jgi:ketosteroid isomerase-like protein
MTPKQIVTDAFRAWSEGTSYVSDIFDETMTWEIVGQSAASAKYADKQAFVDGVLQPFGRRFGSDDPFRPVKIRSVIAEDDTVVVTWDGVGTTVAGTTYANTYAWFMRLEDGLVVDGVAFFDSITFNRLWNDVAPV